MTTGDYDVVIVGAGVAGCISAYELAPDHDVLVIDKGQVAGETTGRSSGLITVTTDVLVPRAEMLDVPAMASHVNSYVRDLDGTGEFEFVERPGIELVPPDQKDSARDYVADLQEDGLAVTYLEPDELEAHYPDTFTMDSFAGAVLYEDVGWVDPYTYTTTLQQEAESQGAEFRTGVEVEDVTFDNGAVTGVETQTGHIEADYVVCAAGWRTREMLSDVIEIPVRPFRIQIVTLDPGQELGDEYPMAWDARTDLYWRPDAAGHIHVGGGEYTLDEPQSASDDVDEWYVDLVAETLPTCLTDFEKAGIADSWACIDGATPDAVGIVDAPTDAPDGLVIATGFHGLGMMLSPITGTAVRSLITGEDTPFSLDGIALDRFDSRGVDFEFQPIGGGAMRE
ncbi:NAD(P)/FAD-dependent oxidoreductase [Natribaculum luteum]|uniref:NAD(P)/FAD-dependent oxidoreductase n=1 Tax=Natribaculum luteum TaxID=1586232 RepID=A0ABD5P361_9EURY|nr:FAD-dependent oxidoreductase [Natribaculum luteum]